VDQDVINLLLRACLCAADVVLQQLLMQIFRPEMSANKIFVWPIYRQARSQEGVGPVGRPPPPNAARSAFYGPHFCQLVNGFTSVDSSGRENQTAEQIPATCAATIKECDRVLFPNMFMLLKVACTLPVTSCECERSASTLRRLNTFMRASTGEERLSSLALIHTHYDIPIDLDKTCLPNCIQEGWN